MTITRELVTQAEHARRCNVSRKSVTIWKSRGQLVLVGDLVDFEASYKGERWHFSVQKISHENGAKAVERRLASGTHAATPNRLAPVTILRGEVIERLRALDWTQAFDWSGGAIRARVIGAAEAVGLQAVESRIQDDGHWGGYQLRNVELQERLGPASFDVVVAGYGFELDEWETLRECRERLDCPEHGPADLDDPITIQLARLALLAYPFGPLHPRPPSAPPNGASRQETRP